MIAEPYICLEGQRAGTIEWVSDPMTKCHGRVLPDGKLTMLREMTRWQSYADFEREKLKVLGCEQLGFGIGIDAGGFVLDMPMRAGSRKQYSSSELQGYDSLDYDDDSEFSRLLKRAEFLKAVCEKEGVEWLAKPKRFHELNGEDREKVRVSLCICEESRELTCPAHCPHNISFAGDCLECGKPERDYYTKAEVDALLKDCVRFAEGGFNPPGGAGPHAWGSAGGAGSVIS